MKQYLAINLLAEQRPKLLLDLTAIMSQTHCTFEATRLVMLGTKASYAFLAAGTWDALHKLQTQLQQFCKEQDIQICVARSSKPAPSPTKLLCYTLELTTHEKAGILNEIAQFLTAERVETEEIFASSYHSRTGTQMSQLIMRLFVQAETNLVDLRERFMSLCERLNIDAALEPERV